MKTFLTIAFLLIAALALAGLLYRLYEKRKG